MFPADTEMDTARPLNRIFNNGAQLRQVGFLSLRSIKLYRKAFDLNLRPVKV